VAQGVRLVGPRVMLREAETEDWRPWRTLRDLSRAFLKPWEPEWPANSLTSSFFDGMLRRQNRDWRRGKAYGFLVFMQTNNFYDQQEGPDKSPSPWGGVRGGVQKKPFYTPHLTSPQGGRDFCLVGGISLNDVRRGIAQKATLGYWIGMPYAGQGLMTEAAGLVCEFAFDALKLNRIEASCMPNNEPSKRLLKRLGFVEEGYAKSYLRIDGEWQDHVLWGKTAARVL
jgi:ribosomal-protein-alanine N-acetyltransferase